jgi:hypothetical protein
MVPHGSATTIDQDIVVTNTDVVPLTGLTYNITGANPGSFGIVPANPAAADGCSTTLGAGQSCVITVSFIPNSGSQAARNATLTVNTSAGSQTVALTGHDAIAAVAVSATTVPAGTPALVATPPNVAAVTGTITITNTSTFCAAAGACLTTGIPAGYPAPSTDAGPIVPTSITLTPGAGTGTWAVGGTCAVGTAINPGQAAIPANPATGSTASAYVPSGNCTVTATYTPPATCTATATATCAGSATVRVLAYGTAGATQPATILTRTITAN